MISSASRASGKFGSRFGKRSLGGLGPARLVRQERLHGGRQRRQIARRNDRAATVRDHIGEDADIGGDHGHAAGQGFQGREAETFPALGRDEEVERAVPALDVAMLADEEDAVRKAGARDPRLQVALEARVFRGRSAGDHGLPAGVAGQERDHRVNEEVRALLVPHAAEAADRACPGVETEFGARGGRASWMRAEAVEVDAVVDHGMRHREIGARARRGRDHGVHPADQPAGVAGVAALRGGGEDETSGMRATSRRRMPGSISTLRRACQMRKGFAAGRRQKWGRSRHRILGRCGGRPGPSAATARRLACSGTSWMMVEVTPDRRRLKLGATTRRSRGSGRCVATLDVSRSRRAASTRGRSRHRCPPARGAARAGRDESRPRLAGYRPAGPAGRPCLSARG